MGRGVVEIARAVLNTVKFCDTWARTVPAPGYTIMVGSAR